MNSTQKLKILNLSISHPQQNSFESTHEEAAYACINIPSLAFESGNVIALPHGKFNIGRVLDQLPKNWKPDLISISSSLALSQNPPIPMGLDKIDCPSVMKLTDSHHMDRPIQKLIEYSRAVGCNYHWTTYDRHHVHFFREAGLKNVFWVPGSINIKPYQVESVPARQKKYDVVFLGSRGKTHAYRESLLEFLEKSNINVTVMRLPYQESLQAYAESKIVLNCSLNGDFNRRVYEALMAQGFLLTDRLTPEAGLALCFQEGQHLDLYSSKYELLEKIKYYLAHPDQREDIAQKGHEKFMTFYRPETVRQNFYDFVLKSKPLPDIYHVKDDSRNNFHCSKFDTLSLSLETRIEVYEFLQELHRINQEIKILYYCSSISGIASDIRDLPRAKITFINSASDVVNNVEKFHILIIDDLDSNTSALLEYCTKKSDSFPLNYDVLLLAGDVKLSPKINFLLRYQGFYLTRFTGYQKVVHLAYKRFKKKDNFSKSLNFNMPIHEHDAWFFRVLKSRIKRVKSLVKSFSESLFEGAK